MALIKQYSHEKNILTPLLIWRNWQIIQINYYENQAVRNIKSINIHFETDEVLALLDGQAVLIVAAEQGSDLLIS